MDTHHPHPHQNQHPQEHVEMVHDPALGHTPYGFYPSEPTNSAAYTQHLPFAHPHHPQQMPNYEGVQNAHQPRHLSATDLQAFHIPNLGLMHNQPYPNPLYPGSGSPPANVNLPQPLTSSSPPPPQSPSYDPLSPPVSGSDTSAEGLYHSRNSSGTTSPSSSRGASLVHRHPLRYNPTPSPTSSSGHRRSRSRRSLDSDDEDSANMMSVVQEIANGRKEATRRQRIEAEQRRRDELRDGYARLKDVLPVSNQKSSKVSLLERATNYITQLDRSNRQMQARLLALEGEVQRLRSLNEKITLSVGNTPEAASSILGQPMLHAMERPLSPPPESHNLVPVTSEPPREDSSGSDGGF